MKHLIAVLTLAISMPTYAQITITQSDLSSASQSFTITRVNNPVGIDPGMGGANQTWDFSTLAADQQDLDTFVSVSSTPLFMQLVFNNPFDPDHDADFAQPNDNLDSLVGLPLTGYYDFFIKESAGYERVGFGANISGIDLPIPLDPVDRVYQLPMSFGQQDSSDSAFDFSIPGFGYYGQALHRVNRVDGWGDITTPFGTFTALRVVSELHFTDSIYFDSTGTGQTIPRPLEREYKWLAAGEGVPVLQINTQTVANIETASAARWLGTPTGTLVAEKSSAPNATQVYPNPATTRVSIAVVGGMDSNNMVTIFALDGRAIVQQRMSGPRIDLNLEGVDPGVYIVAIDGYAPQRLVVTE